MKPKAANAEPARRKCCSHGDCSIKTAFFITAHIPDSPGITESRGFRYVTAGIVFLVVVTAIALTIYFVRKAQEEKSNKRFF